jgi:hypothetical protein
MVEKLNNTLPIEYVNISNSISPAKLDIENGIIFINKPVFDLLPGDYQRFIIAHEEGHYYLKTYSEFEADKYAFKKLAGQKNGSLMAIYNTILEVLPYTDFEHYVRFANIYQNILQYNYEETGDKKYIEEKDRFSVEFNKLMKEINENVSFYGYNHFLTYDNEIVCKPTKETVINPIYEVIYTSANNLDNKLSPEILPGTDQKEIFYTETQPEPTKKNRDLFIIIGVILIILILIR